MDARHGRVPTGQHFDQSPDARHTDFIEPLTGYQQLANRITRL